MLCFLAVVLMLVSHLLMPCLLAAVLAAVAPTGLGICAACWPSLVLQCIALPQDTATAYNHCFVLGTIIGSVWQFCSLPVWGSGLCWLVLLVAALLPDPEMHRADAHVQNAIPLQNVAPLQAVAVGP
jgi:hypothetical protein